MTTFEQELALRSGNVEAIKRAYPAGDTSPTQLEQEIAAVESYLLSCVRRRDWHGVSDAANEIRILEAIRDERVKQSKGR